jgi:hypothetical protein
VSIRFKHRIEFGFLGISLALSFLLGRGIQTAGRPEEILLHCYGGRLPSETQAALEKMNLDFHDARDVLSIGSRCVLIEDRNGFIREYQYSGSTLWLNREPVLSRVSALNFEFRDEWGNLLTHRSGNCGLVHTIGCTLRLADRPSETFVNSRTALPLNRNHTRGMETSQVAFRQPD